MSPTRKLWNASRISLILCTLGIIYAARPGSSLFSWHPTLLSLSFVLMVESIACIVPDGRILPLAWKKNKITFHWSLQAVSAALALAGFIVIYVHKTWSGKVHFTSWHSWIAISALLTFTLEACGGIFLHYGRHLKLHKKLGGTPVIRKLHAASGLGTVLAFAATITLGFVSNWANAFLWESCVFLFVPIYIFPVALISKHVSGIIARMGK